MQAVGTGIYLAPSILDHSCSPNAVATFDGFKLRIQLTQELPKLEWDSIRISYIDLMNSKSHRKKELKDRYYFDCDCPRCKNDDIDCYHYAAKCPTCQKPVIAKVGINYNNFESTQTLITLFYRKVNNFLPAFADPSLIHRLQNNFGKLPNLVSNSCC